jgi:hypothetical protein
MSDEGQLNPAERELEMALRSLRPAPAQIDPVAAAFAAGCRVARTRLRLWQTAAAAAMIAAAGGAWLMLAPLKQGPDGARRQSAVVEARPTAAKEWSGPPLTWFVYRQALARSPAELDALLDLQATFTSGPDGQCRSLGMLTAWNAQLRSLSGEM